MDGFDRVSVYANVFLGDRPEIKIRSYYDDFSKQWRYWMSLGNTCTIFASPKGFLEIAKAIQFYFDKREGYVDAGEGAYTAQAV